jgi:hypothetical protein
MRAFCLGVTGLLLLTHTTTAQTAPQTSPPGLHLHALLLLPEVQTELRLRPEEITTLENIVRFYQNAAAETLKNTQDKTKVDLQQETVKLGRLKDQEILDLLGSDRVKRLAQIKLQLQGPSALFLPPLMKQVGVTSAQQREFAQAEAKMRESLFRTFSAQPLERDETSNLQRLQNLYDRAKRQLDQTIITNILTTAQKAQWETLIGKPFVSNASFFPARQVLAQFQYRLTNPVPKFLELYSVFDLVRIPLVQQKTGIGSADLENMQPYRLEWEEFHTKFSQSIEKLPPDEQVSRASVFGRDRLTKWKEIDQKLAEALGPVKYQRLKQIRFQMLGFGSLLGAEYHPLVGLTQEQESAILAINRQAIAALRLALRQAGSDTTEELLGKYQEEIDQKIYAALSKDQQQKIRELQGQLLTPDEKKTIRKASTTSPLSQAKH